MAAFLQRTRATIRFADACAIGSNVESLNFADRVPGFLLHGGCLVTMGGRLATSTMLFVFDLTSDLLLQTGRSQRPRVDPVVRQSAP